MDKAKKDGLKIYWLEREVAISIVQKTKKLGWNNFQPSFLYENF